MRHFSMIITLVMMLAATAHAGNDGIPFFRNYAADVYNAHNRNFDVACDDYGSVFVANFEGLLYFDGAHWRKVHTPGISRVTCLAKDQKGRIWLGGHNLFGYIDSDESGRIKIKTIISDAEANNLSEVDFIKITDKDIFIHTSVGKAYRLVEEKKLVPVNDKFAYSLQTSVDSVKKIVLPNSQTIECSYAHGLRISGTHGAVTSLNEEDGLISNTINHITFNNNHMVWAATDRGMFCIETNTPYSQLTENQGLKGEVNVITELGNAMYIGTTEGIYIYKGGKISRMIDADQACWQMIYSHSGREMLAATSSGLFSISPNGMRRISDRNTLSVCLGTDFSHFLTGEVDGIYSVGTDGSRKLLAKIEKAVALSLKGKHIMAETIFGELWQLDMDGSNAKCIRKKADVNVPKATYTGRMKGNLMTWTTDAEGRNLKSLLYENRESQFSPWFHPLSHIAINCIFQSSDFKVWFGSGSDVFIVDSKQLGDISKTKSEKPYIREIIAMGDSVLWGGYARKSLAALDMIKIEESLPSSCRNITVYFSTRTQSIVHPTQYRYRLNNSEWSNWSEETVAHLNNLLYGNMVMEVQARDVFGRESEISTVRLRIAPPFYFTWWALLSYVLIIIGIIAQIMKLRTQRLNREKEKLESIVKNRTAELSDALNDLKRTQKDLVRMERTATAGKLTQGLIDRILNPINYINNFSRLTSGLAKDLRDDIEDEKDNISEDNYEDCEDILDMMSQNLVKIEEHGTNTTRTLRAMEAMLNNHIGTLKKQNILPLCHQAVEVSADYHKAVVAECGIVITHELPDTEVIANIDAEATNRILLSLITNSVYATAKKYHQTPYEPIIKLTVEDLDDFIRISIYDNGIGIEDTIKEKVYDPFFTTKPTGEAAGVGLYLVRELVHDQNGTISFTSEKDNYCEFVIELHKK